MALDFPANPTDGQVYGSYVYDYSVGVWKSLEEQSAVVVNSPTAPESALPGDLWFNSSIGALFNYYSDGTSSQWIEILSSSATDAPTINSINDISDVDVDSVANGNGLVFDAVAGKWISSKDTDAIKMNTQTISSNYTIPSGYNGMSAGPITIANNVVVTIPDGSSWSIV